MAKRKDDGISRRNLVKLSGAGALAAMASGLAPRRAKAAPAKGRAILFDVGGTMLDWSVMPEKMTRFFAEKGLKVDGKALWLPWRAKLFSYMMYNSMIGNGFMPLEELAARSTLAVTRSMNIGLKPADAGGVLELLGELELHPDVLPGLQKMRDAGYLLAPHTQLSNAILKKAVLSRFTFDRYFTSETFGVYKPMRSLYMKAIDAMGLERSEILYVTTNQFDVFASKGMGFRTGWVNRWNEQLEPYGDTPDWQAKNFVELAKVLEVQKP